MLREKLIIGLMFTVMMFLVSWQMVSPTDEYLNDNRPAKLDSNPSDIEVMNGELAYFTAKCRPKQKWQYSIDNGVTWNYIIEDEYIPFNFEIEEDSLKILNATLDIDGYLFRIICCKENSSISNPKDDCVISRSAKLTVYSTLPIHWIRFECSRIEEKNRLSWYSEDEFEKIYIERRDISGRWISIGELNPKKTVNFTFEDENPLIGHNYYRIKGIFPDGRYEYSKIAVIHFSEEYEYYKYTDIYGREVKTGLEPYKLYFRISENTREKIIIH